VAFWFGTRGAQRIQGMAAGALDLDADDLALGQLAVAMAAADFVHVVSLSGFWLTG